LADDLLTLQNRITELEQQLAQVQMSEARYARIAANVPGMLYQFVQYPDDMVSFTYVSDGARTIYEIEPGDIVRDAGIIIAAIHPDDRSDFEESVAYSAATLMSWSWEGRIVVPSGAQKWVQAASRPVRRDDGAIVWDGVLLDITKRKQAEAELRLFKALVDNSPDAIGVSGADGHLFYTNAAQQALSGHGAALTGLHYSVLYPQSEQATLAAANHELFARGLWQGELNLQHKAGQLIPIQVTIFPINITHGQLQGVAVIARDLTHQKQAEVERIALQEQVIASQQAILRELSTPLIPLAEGIVAMPLVGAIDTARAQQIMETLLEGIGSQGATTAILDITGVRMIDTQVAQALVQAAYAAHLLGARVILTGIRPEVAQSLVHLGIDLSRIITRSTLQNGIAYALGH
jgi:rsbT co-antagonist protein RsbR